MKTFPLIALLFCALLSYASPSHAMNQKTHCEPTGSIAPLRFNPPSQAAVLNSNLTAQEIKQRYEALENALVARPVDPKTISLLAFTVKSAATPCVDKDLQKRVAKSLAQYKKAIQASIAYYSEVGSSTAKVIAAELAAPTVPTHKLKEYLARGLLAANCLRLFGIEPSFEKDLLQLSSSIKRAINIEPLNPANN